MLNNKWLVFESHTLLSKSLAKDILMIAENAIENKGCFSIVLAGGESPIKLYEILKTSKSNWDKWHVYIGDERCVPADNSDRNDAVIKQVWLNSGFIKKSNIHFIRSELGMLNAQLDYETTLNKVDSFDVVLLSMGDDGHTASLFPNHAYSESNDVVLEYNSPKPPLKRISMSFNRLNKANYVFKIVRGESKKKAVESWLKGRQLPIVKIKGTIEHVYACADALPKSYIEV